MPIELALTAFGRARVWLGESPNLTFRAGLPVMREAAGGTVLPRDMATAVELSVPVGARINYGLLAATFRASATGTLRVEVFPSLEDGPAVDRSLVGALDQVRAGLPHEFAGAVADGAFASAVAAGWGPGTLRFDRAAHGAVGSSSAFFARIAGTVVRLITLGPVEGSDPRLRDVLEGRGSG